MSDLLREAAQDVANAWTVTGPDVALHLQMKGEVRSKWPTLGLAVDRLAELMEPDWEYNIETEHLDPYTLAPTGRKEVHGLWTENVALLEKGVENLRKKAEFEAQGPARKLFRIVKRKKQGYEYA